MSIQIQLPPDIEAQLAAEAEARGMAIESYIRLFVEEKILQDRTVRKHRHHAVEAMLAFAETHRGGLNGEIIKGMVHEGHKY
jgi:hypothetical protein